jgi:hypothetical protein
MARVGPGFKFFFPITTMLIVSAVLSIIAMVDAALGPVYPIFGKAMTVRNRENPNDRIANDVGEVVRKHA